MIGVEDLGDRVAKTWDLGKEADWTAKIMFSVLNKLNWVSDQGAQNVCSSALLIDYYR